ncbi:MAG: phage protein Gp27 family protein [Pseudomonadota bacterium]
MPRGRKIDKLTDTHRDWLREEIVKAGYGDYEDIAENLNARLAASGSAFRIQKSAIAEYGRELKENARLTEFARLQERSMEWARRTASDVGIEAEAESHRVLVQMLNNLAFKSLESQADDPIGMDPKQLHFYARALKDLVSSSGLREKQLSDAEERGREREREVQAEKLETALADGEIDLKAAERAREILGFG